MKYLVDSLQRYENDYSNSLCPVQNEPDQSFMGDHTLLQPVTVQEFRMLGTTIMSALKIPTACSQLVTVNTPGLPPAGLPNQIISTPTTTESLNRPQPLLFQLRVQVQHTVQLGLNKQPFHLQTPFHSLVSAFQICLGVGVAGISPSANGTISIPKLVMR